jgi:hypothetical protein
MIDSGFIALRVAKKDAWLLEKILEEKCEWWDSCFDELDLYTEYHVSNATDMWDDELKFLCEGGLDFMCLREGSEHRLPSTVISFDGTFMDVECDFEWNPVVVFYSDNSFNPLLELGFANAIRREWAWRVSRGESLSNLDAFKHLV